jgi:addiction module RelE/StbE family toxin
VTLIRWTDQAVEDLRRVREYIERDSPRYGRLVAERLYEATQRLEMFPRSGRVVPEFNLDHIREIIAGEYRIVYRVEADAVTLLTVFRSTRVFPVEIGPE